MKFSKWIVASATEKYTARHKSDEGSFETCDLTSPALLRDRLG